MSLLKRLFDWPKREPTRAQMDEALKRIVVPGLRRQGFKGSQPHFRRPRDGHVDLLSFQFSQWGGRFCVEAARCRPEGIDGPGDHVPAAKAKAWDLPTRHRVGSEQPGYDHWFAFEKEDPPAVAELALAKIIDPRTWEIVDTLPMDWPEKGR